MKTETAARNYRHEKEATYSPEEASRAYDAAAIECFGPDFATLNFPPDVSLEAAPTDGGQQ